MDFSQFKQRFQLELNPQQDQAVQQTEGPVLLLAVPGSGKTTVLVSRLGYMIWGKGIPPEQILTVTYTVAATRDMRQRFARRFGEDMAARLTFRTINGICAVVVQRYAVWKGTQPFELITDEKQLNTLVRELLTRQGIPFPSDQQVKDARTHITYCKNMMLTEEQIGEHTVDGMDFPTLYRSYQSWLRENHRMDYDDQMVFTHRIFRQYPQLLEQFQRRYPYICVDEAQDTSKIQHAILRQLAAASGNLFMVGDEDQSIYGFRAAWPQALLEFDQVYPTAKVLIMQNNYRSTRTIVAHADQFIQRNKKRHPKHMTTQNPEGPAIRKQVLKDYNRQYHYLLQVARTCSQSTAVLYRNNDSALPLIDLLHREGIPFASRQREGFFFTSPLVRDLVDMLEFSYDDTDRERFLRFYYKLDLKVKKAVVVQALNHMQPGEGVLDVLCDSPALESWQQGKARALRTHFSKLSSLTSYGALHRLVQFMGYGDYLKEQHADTAKLDVLLTLANHTPQIPAFLARLEELRAILEGLEAPSNCPFVLSTIHASKGLEYDRVILIDASRGIFPAVDDRESLSPEEEETLEEERRLFYVGVTRARKELELLCYENKFGEALGVSFPFVEQLLGEEKDSAPEKKKLSVRSVPTSRQVAAWEKDYTPGTIVVHKMFGPGVLQSRSGSIAVISFEKTGDKKLDLPTCLKQGTIKLK